VGRRERRGAACLPADHGRHAVHRKPCPRWPAWRRSRSVRGGVAPDREPAARLRACLPPP
jgi:hypothetical protein